MSFAAANNSLPDLQNMVDYRGKRIERAGVRGVKIPLKVARKEDDALDLTVQASVSMYVSVEHEIKGANMSRFAECLMNYSSSVITGPSLRTMLNDMLERLQSTDGFIEVRFDYFVPRYAPVSQLRSVQAYNVAFTGRMVDSKYDFITEVNVTGTNLCPCSKEISKYGAHNQRNNVRVKMSGTDSTGLYWLEDIIELVERNMSCPIFPLLKRVDEKYVTEKAYENPKFVEDMVRDIALELDKCQVPHYHIRSQAEESIHHHEAEAYLSKNWILG